MNREQLIIELSKEILSEFHENKLPPEINRSKQKTEKIRIEKLRKEFGKEKIIPKEFEEHILYALSFYPELKNERINFRVKPAVFLMETRMTLGSIFSKKRTYTITIKKKYASFLLSNFSVKGLAGLICHELGHVLDYSRKSNFQLAGFSLKYIFPQSRRRIELLNDLRTFYHGTCDSMILYEEEYFKSPLKNSFKNYRKSYYLQIEELKRLKNKNLKIIRKT